MTFRERVYGSLQWESGAIVPYNVTFTSESARKMAEYYRDDDFQGMLGNHLATISHRKLGKWREVAPGRFMDEWGVVWNRTVDKDIGVVENRVLAEDAIGGWTPPDPHSDALVAAYPGFIESGRDRFRLASLGLSLFERGWSLRGMDRLLMDMVENPEFVDSLFEAITNYNLAQLDLSLAHDIDGVWFGDDWGSQNGLIMGPALWRRYIKPCLARMYGKVKRAGKYVAIHSCGDVRAILPDLVELGCDIFNPFQPETLDLSETKDVYHGKLAFWGGLSVQTLLPHGTPEEVRVTTRALLDTLGKGGGYIAAPSHAVPPDVPAENIDAMIEVLRSQ